MGAFRSLEANPPAAGAASGAACVVCILRIYRGALLIRNRPTLAPYRRAMPRRGCRRSGRGLLCVYVEVLQGHLAHKEVNYVKMTGTTGVTHS